MKWLIIIIIVIFDCYYCGNGRFNVDFDDSVVEGAKNSVMIGINMLGHYIDLQHNVSISIRNDSIATGIIAETHIPNYCFDYKKQYQLITSALCLQKYGTQRLCTAYGVYHDMVIILSPNTNYYFRESGTSIKFNQYDLATVIAHEGCHGLGIVSNLQADGTYERFNSPTSYDVIVFNLNSNAHVSNSSFTNNSLSFPFFNLKYPLYAKRPFWIGTSIIHGFYGLMNYKGLKGVEACEIDIYTLNILKQLGYTVRNCDNPDFSTICGYCNSGVPCVISTSNEKEWFLNFLFNE